MRTLVVSLFLGIIWVCVVAQEVPSSSRLNLQEDPRLQVPVSFRARYISLSDFTKRLSRLTGATIGVSAEYADEKLTLFVKERPAWEVMERAAEVLNLEWGEGIVAGSYRITRSRKRIEEETEYRRRRAQEREGLVSSLRQLMERARQDFALWVQEEKARILEGHYSDPILLDYLTGKFVATWSSRDWERFWSGEAMVGCYPPVPGFATLPAESRVWWTQQQELTSFQERIQMESDTLPLVEEHSSLQPPKRVYLVLQYDVSANIIYRCVTSDFGDETLNSAPFFSGNIVSSPPKDRPLGELPDELTEVGLQRERTPFPCEKDYQYCGFATQLEWIAENYEVNIIAQAFRRKIAEKISFGANNLHETLRNMRQYLSFGYKEGYLTARYLDAPALRPREIPERVITVLENRFRLKLDDYAWLASQLTPVQASEWNITFARVGYLDIDSKIDFDVLRGNVYALRFWASLTEAQKRTVLQGNSLFYAQLSPLQKQKYEQAVLGCASVCAGAILPSYATVVQAGRILLALRDPEKIDELQFYAQSEGVLALYTSAPVKRQGVQFELTFGLNTTMIRYELVILEPEPPLWFRDKKHQQTHENGEPTR